MQSVRFTSFIVRRFRVRGFTLIEMLTAVAALVILLGLMVSLARYVRSRSADRLTRDLLKKLEDQLHLAPEVQTVLSGVPPLIADPEAPLTEDALQFAALSNNQRFVSVWNSDPANHAMLRALPLSI